LACSTMLTQHLDTGSSDTALLELFRSGSDDAATVLHERYAKRLHAFVKSRCPRDLSARLDADDIVQAVFRGFFQAAKKGSWELSSRSKIWSILSTIAGNEIREEVDFHHAAKRDVSITSSGEQFDRAIENMNGSEMTGAIQEMTLHEAIIRLPEHQRHVVELRLEGHEVAQIAHLTGRSKRTVERILNEVRATFSQLFA
jgi:RNA polymerase sigma factor (sigma-70 family)